MGEDGGNLNLFQFAQKIHEHLSAGTMQIASWHKLVFIIFNQMVSAIEFLHSHSICHFDVSLENFLIKGVDVVCWKGRDGKKIADLCYNEKSIQIKLCDFGLASGNLDKSNFQSTRFVGKLLYFSPECNNRDKPFDAKSNDIWCLSVCLFMLILGGAPYLKPSKSDKSFAAIMNGKMGDLIKFWEKMNYVNDDILELFDLMFQFEPKRANLSMIKQCLSTIQ